jgi:DNA-binding transcriptional ArsR family regulator
MTISRPAVSQHLKVLKESGLITETRQGTRHYFAIAPEGLGELRAYLDGLWGDALAAFALHVAQKEQDP